jgi:DNA-binding MarR family transcriptional regulator
MARKTAPQARSFELSSSASHLLHRAEQLAADRFAELAGEAVTLRQFAVLAAIAENPGLSQSDLVRATGIDRSTLADMMNRLVKRGLVSRSASKTDARAYAVRLTAAGGALFRSTLQHARAADEAVLERLAQTKRKNFLSTLATLARLAEEAAAELKAAEGPPRARPHAKKRAKKRKTSMAAARTSPVRRERA